MKRVFFWLSILFTILTIVGVVYVLSTGGKGNAGYAVIPMLLTFMCQVAYRGKRK